MKKRHRNRTKLLGSLLTGGVATVLALPTAGWAQSADAALRGQAPPNSVVTAKNLATGAVRRTNAGADGAYTLAGLPAGTYRVDAGPGTEHTVTVTVASVATLDLGAGTGTTAEGTLEEIIVKATRLIEVKTSEIGTTVSQHQIDVTPQITRNFLEFADAVPGMSFQVDSNGRTSLHSGTQSTSSSNVYIDGVGQKNYVRSGGITGQAGSDASGSRNPGDSGNPFPQLAIGEYKVITSNYKAEYDQISGAAITAQTKSGTNSFHGEVFGDYTTASWRAVTPAEDAAGGAKVGGPSKEYGFAVGGPIIQDQLHYFFTYEGKRFTTPNVVKPPSISDANGNLIHPELILSTSLRGNYGPVSNPFNEDLYFGKLDWEVTDRDRLEMTAKVRRESQVSGAGGVIAASAAFNYLNQDTRGQLRWEHNGDHWLNDALVTYEDTVDAPTPIGPGPGAVYVYTDSRGGFDQLLQIDGQSPTTFFRTTQKGEGLQDDFTLSDLTWAGDHTVKMGVKFKDVKLSARDASTAAVYYYYVAPPGTVAPLPTSLDANPFQVQFGNKVNNGSPITATSSNQQFGVYFQDDWVINARFTLNLGVRYDLEKTPSYTGYVTPAATVAAIFGPDTQINPVTAQTYAQTLANGGVNINNYISNGHNRKDPSNEVQPRLGFSFDINGDQRHVIFAGAGRAYDRNLFDVLQKEVNKSALSEPTIQFRSASAPPDASCGTTSALTATCLDWNPIYLTAAGLQTIGGGAGEQDLINNNLKAPYSDQYSIGMRNKVGDWNTSATIAQINSHDGLVGQWGNRYPNGNWYDASCGPWCSGGVPGLGTLILWDNGRETRNTEVLLSAEKPYTRESGWAATIAYTYSNAKENVFFSDNYQFDYPSVKEIGRVTSPAVPKHRLVLTGSVDGAWGMTYAGKLTLESVKPYVTNDGQCNDKNGNATPCVPFGSPYFYIAQYLGNPTFAYKAIDLQASKSIDLPRGLALQVRLDVLNAANAKNYDSQSVIDPWPNPAYFNRSGPILGVPRTVKLTMDVKW
jgi:outer membrane receptor protein involved in Fe transport